MVMARFRELNNLTPKRFNIIKIESVINEQNKNIFNACLKVSDLLKDKKLVKDFLKLWSKISINNIIENKK